MLGLNATAAWAPSNTVRAADGAASHAVEFVEPMFNQQPITIIRQVQKKLNAKVGDVIMYFEDEKGNIIIKKGQLKPI